MFRARARRRKGLLLVTERLVAPADISASTLPEPKRPIAGGLSHKGRRALANVSILIAGALAAALLLDEPDATFASFWLVAVIVVVRSDLEDFIIPDGASAAIAGLGVLHGLVLSILAGNGWQDTSQVLVDCSVAGAAAFVAFWCVARGFRAATGRDGLGFGDVKLAGACGIWLGFDDQIIALEIASLAAIAILLAGRRRTAQPAAVPFGAFLAPAAWLVFVGGPALHGFIDLHA